MNSLDLEAGAGQSLGDFFWRRLELRNQRLEPAVRCLHLRGAALLPCSPPLREGRAKTHENMVSKIVQAGEPVLRNRARLLSANEIRSKFIQELIDRMR